MTAHTIGNPADFAIVVEKLGAPPLDGDPAASRTWARMELWIGGSNVFRHRHRGEREIHEAVNWPAIYLARWVVRGWDEIFHPAPLRIERVSSEPLTDLNGRDASEALDRFIENMYFADDAIFDARDRYVLTHSLRAGGGGAALPDVYFSRHDEIVVVAWAESTDGAEVSFEVTRDQRDIQASSFARVIHDFVHMIYTWLGDVPRDSDAELLGSWLTSFCAPEAAWRGMLNELRLDPARAARLIAKAQVKSLSEFFDVPPSWENAGTLASSSECTFALAARCTSLRITDEDLMAIRDAIVHEPPSDDFSKLGNLASAIVLPPHTDLPHEQGYVLAERVRRAIGNRADYLDVEALILSLGADIKRIELSDSSIDGGAICDERHGPAVLLNGASSYCDSGPGERAVLAHELCHLLFDRGVARKLGILSGPWAPSFLEKRANAFAVELLAPQGALRALARIHTGKELVRKVMAKFGIGEEAATKHVSHRA